MDESGVRVGCLTGEKVIVPTTVKELYTATPENRKSISIIETICLDGSLTLAPVVICPGEKIIEAWVHTNLTDTEVIAVSQTNYTYEATALSWLQACWYWSESTLAYSSPLWFYHPPQG